MLHVRQMQNYLLLLPAFLLHIYANYVHATLNYPLRKISILMCQEKDLIALCVHQI